ncbi:nucleotide exchange factor GrpE [bacterium]|nr:nucleotide exchange factor GrpE [bacterium]
MEKNKENNVNKTNHSTNQDNNKNKPDKNNNHVNESNNLNNQLTIENKQLKEQVQVLNTKLEEALSEIKKINSDYVDKIAQKSIKAQKIINQKEQELQEKYALELKDKIARYIQKKLSKMLDSINQLSRVLAVEPQNDELKKYLMGFKMILAEFENSLVEMDIATVNVKIGDIFDETIMTAFEVVELPGFSSNTVVEVISPAYKYEDKIIKHAVVKVQK